MCEYYIQPIGCKCETDGKCCILISMFNLCFLIVESVWLSVFMLDYHHDGCYHLYNFVHGLYLTSLMLFVTTFTDYWAGAKNFIFRVSYFTFIVYSFNLFFRVSTISSFGLVMRSNQTEECSVYQDTESGSDFFFVFMILNCVYFSINTILLTTYACKGIVYCCTKCCEEYEERISSKLKKELEETKKQLEEAKSSQTAIPVVRIVSVDNKDEQEDLKE